VLVLHDVTVIVESAVCLASAVMMELTLLQRSPLLASLDLSHNSTDSGLTRNLLQKCAAQPSHTPRFLAPQVVSLL
jgi:hypothetical protein